MTKTTTHIPFSVCMSVYRNDNPTDFIHAVHSIAREQTCPPDEIILVVDGPIPTELEDAISTLRNSYTILHVVRLDKNSGRAIARQTALEHAHNEWVAVMDSDDISLPDRFEQQLAYIEAHPEVSVVGGQISEFMDTTTHIVGKREVPLCHTDIAAYLKYRCPMNMITCMFRRSHVLQVGGFIDWYCEEDYYLWIRMIIAGHRMGNLSQDLALVRVSNGMYGRRGGWRYFGSERRVQRFMLDNHIISPAHYAYNVLGRFVVQVLMTDSLRAWVFQTLFRK